MGTLLENEYTWVSQVRVPNPGEPVRAGKDYSGSPGPKITLAGDAGSVNGDVSYYALAAGVRIRHLGGISKTRAVSVSGSDITVQLGTDGAGAVLNTSSATQIAADVNAHASASLLVNAVAGGTGADKAGIWEPWTALAGGSRGSIRPSIEDLAARTSYLWQQSAYSGLAARLWSENGTQFEVYGAGSLARGLSSTVTPVIVADTWYYVYWYMVSTTVTLDVSTTPPDASSGYAYKQGDATRRYLGCFRTYDNAGTPNIVPFRSDRGQFMYEEAQLVHGTLSDTSWTTKALATRVPTHVRQARLLLSIADPGAVNAIRVRRAGGTRYQEVAGITAFTVKDERICALSGGQNIDYQLNAGTGTGSISVAGFTE